MFPFEYLYRRQPDARRYKVSRFRNSAENMLEGNLVFTSHTLSPV